MDLSRPNLTWTNKSDRRIQWQTNASQEGVTVQSKNWIDFDGYTWFKITLSGRGSVNTFSLDIPFYREFATHWYSATYPPANNPTGYTPREYFASAPRNLARIGGYVRGLQWSWESEEGWHLRNRAKAL